jgi:hypothetical protein
MKLSILLSLGLLSVSMGARAHDVPYPGQEQNVDWRLIGESRVGAVFVGDIRRVGRSASFLSMLVLREPAEDEAGSFDAVTYPGLVDCDTKRYELERGSQVRGGMPLPPPLARITAPSGVDIEAVDDREPPDDVATPLYRLLEIACGEAKLPATVIGDPYRWARQRFGLRTPPAAGTP